MYESIKTHFKTEDYIELNILKSQRSTITQFRFGILPIKIEMGRYKREPIDERICNFCLVNEL